MDWLEPGSEQIIEGNRRLGIRLRDQIMEHRVRFEEDPSWLDIHFPALPFKAECPATFVHVNVVRQLILESKSYVIVPNDGIDFGKRS